MALQLSTKEKEFPFRAKAEKTLPTPYRKRHFASLDEAPNIATLRGYTEAAMSQSAFDPFGEPVPPVEPSIAGDRSSNWLQSAGTGLFWLLIGGIVLARAVYFEPGSFSFDRAVAWVQGVLAFL